MKPFGIDLKSEFFSKSNSFPNFLIKVSIGVCPNSERPYITPASGGWLDILNILSTPLYDFISSKVTVLSAASAIVKFVFIIIPDVIFSFS